MHVQSAECLSETTESVVVQGASSTRIRLFCLVPPAGRVRSFRLAGNPFLSRRPSLPGPEAPSGKFGWFGLWRGSSSSHDHGS